MKTNFFSIFLIIILFISCNENDNISITPEITTPEIPLKEETLINVSYGNDVQQTFDLYLPADRTKNTKTLILVHGGGWTTGDKNDMISIVNIVKNKLPNYAIANINYRLATPEKPAFPMQIDDIKAVINKLKNGNYTISNDLGFIGFSAGGHLSLLYSYDYNANNQVKMVASIVGPTNFTDPNYTNNPEWIKLCFGMSGLNYFDNVDYFKNASPLLKATKSSPPTIMSYGYDDSLIPVTQSKGLHEKLNELGVYNELNLYKGGHGNWSTDDQVDSYAKLVNFVKKKF